MSFALYATRGTTTVQLNGGDPFRLERAEGLGANDVARQAHSGPLQHGAQDSGYRLQPRMVTLYVLFSGDTDAAVDGYRDTLLALFRPLEREYMSPELVEGIPDLVLQADRDDGTTRTLTIQAVDRLTIDLIPEERAARLHRAVITLRAASPVWYGETTTVSVPVANWALAGGQIGSEFRTYANLSGNADWGVGSNIFDDWTVVMLTPDLNLGNGTATYAFQSFWNDFIAEPMGRLAWHPGGTGYIYNRGTVGASWPGGTSSNYHVVENRSGTNYWRYWDGTALAVHDSHADDIPLLFTGRWNSMYLLSGTPFNTGPATRGAIYRNVSLDDLHLLAPHILGSVSQVVYATVGGNLPVLPDMVLTGPVTNPVITNNTTGGSINLTGLSVAAGQTVALALRGGDKTLTNSAGSSVMGSVTSAPLGLASFVLEPPASDFDGVNEIALTGSGITSTTTLTITWTDQYTGL